MTQEEKQLLLKDLCARLPYETMFYSDRYGEECLLSIDLEYNKVNELYSLEEIKPYLRPMSSMTEEEINEFILISDTVLWLGDKKSTSILSLEQIDWLNAHHFDYRGLIEKGVALEAKEGMYNIK